MSSTATETPSVNGEFDERLERVEKMSSFAILAAERLAERSFHIGRALTGGLMVILGEHAPDDEAAATAVTAGLAARIAALEDEVSTLKGRDHA